MKYLVVLIAVLMAGCFAHDFKQMRDDAVLKTARFDTGCDSIYIYDEMRDQDYSDRYILMGCGMRVTYKCGNADRARDNELLISGGRETSVCNMIDRQIVDAENASRTMSVTPAADARQKELARQLKEMESNK